MLDLAAMNQAFGDLAVHSGYFVVMLAFGTGVGFMAALKRGGWL